MKKGKRVIGIMIVSLLLVSSMSLISAGLWNDLFGGGDDSDLEGELASAGVDVGVTVTGTYAAPEILWISDLNGNDADTITPDQRNLNLGQSISKLFYINVYSPAGNAALPAAPSKDQVYVIAENIAGNKGVGIQRKSTSACTNVYSGSDDTANYEGGIDIGTVEFIMYECTVNFEHYDDPGVNSWRIYAYAEDLQSNPGPNKEGYDGTTEHNNLAAGGLDLPVRTTGFNEATDVDITENNLNFGSIGFGSDLNRKPLQSPLIQNIGNKDISAVDIKAYDIPDDPDNGDYWVRSEWFYTDPDGADEECNEVSAVPGSLTHDTQKNTGVGPIAYGSPGNTKPSKHLYLCLDKIIASGTIIEGTYSTQGEGGTPWNLEAS